MGFFSKKKKRDEQRNAEQAAINDVIRWQSKELQKNLQKPDYSPATRKKFYDDNNMHTRVKVQAFQQGEVKDPYTGAQLCLEKAEARQKYGQAYQEHLAEADHIDPLNKIVQRNKNKAWITSQDIQAVANDPENYQIISRRTNQNGGKGGLTQEQWSQDLEKMEKLSRQSGRPVEEIREQVRQVGRQAQKNNDRKLQKLEVKNMAQTTVIPAVYSGGTAATLSSVYNVAAVLKGEKKATEAVKDVLKDGGKAAAKGGAVGGGVTVLNHTMASSGNEVISALGKNNAAGKVVTVISVAGDTLCKWGNGEITTQECLMDLGEKGFGYGGSVCGAAVGQIVIPVPIVGAALGSMAGGVASSKCIHGIRMGLENFLEERRAQHERLVAEMLRYYAEKQRREEVKQMLHATTCEAMESAILEIANSRELQRFILELGSAAVQDVQARILVAEHVFAALQLRRYRQELEKYIEDYFGGYEQGFAQALSLMDSALEMGDYEGAIAGANQTVRLFGKEPVVESTEDFKDKLFGSGTICF